MDPTTHRASDIFMLVSGEKQSLRDSWASVFLQMAALSPRIKWFGELWEGLQVKCPQATAAAVWRLSVYSSCVGRCSRRESSEGGSWRHVCGCKSHPSHSGFLFDSFVQSLHVNRSQRCHDKMLHSGPFELSYTNSFCWNGSDLYLQMFWCPHDLWFSKQAVQATVSQFQTTALSVMVLNCQRMSVKWTFLPTADFCV